MSTISSRVWKTFTTTYNNLLVHLFNLICSQALYPDEWKNATVVPLPKIPNANKPRDLRPISLLPLPGKILEHFIHNSIQDYLNNNLISKFQNGFRKNHSTQQTIFNPIDPNPAISARAVFPQSGHIRPEKRPFFQKFPHFSKIESYKK